MSVILAWFKSLLVSAWTFLKSIKHLFYYLLVIVLLAFLYQEHAKLEKEQIAYEYLDNHDHPVAKVESYGHTYVLQDVAPAQVLQPVNLAPVQVAPAPPSSIFAIKPIFGKKKPVVKPAKPNPTESSSAPILVAPITIAPTPVAPVTQLNKRTPATPPIEDLVKSLLND